MSPPPTIIAIAIVVRRCPQDRANQVDGPIHVEQFLVGRREAGVALAGLAEFPGGKVEAGETIEHAAMRECLEETGLAVDVVRQIAEVRHAYPHGTLELHFFHCRLRNSESTARVGFEPNSPYRWVSREELANLEFPAANASVVAKLLRGELHNGEPTAIGC